jgi:hypothetical protein
MQIIGVLAGLAVIGALLVDEGEIVALETREDGRTFVTQLWIVDLDDVRYLRSGRPDTEWLARLRVSPDVELRSPDAADVPALHYRALPIHDAQVRDRVNRAMTDKYGFSDVIWSWVVDRTSSVAIELQPTAPPEAPADAGSVP